MATNPTSSAEAGPRFGLNIITNFNVTQSVIRHLRKWIGGADGDRDQ